MLKTKDTNNKELYTANNFLKDYLSIRNKLIEKLNNLRKNKEVQIYLDLKESKEVKEYLKTIHDIQELDITARKFEKEVEYIEISKNKKKKTLLKRKNSKD